jgi:N-acetylmuramoyl-L-alanine amidase
MIKKWTNESKALASHVLNAITAQMGTKSLGIQPSNVYVVRSGTVPSILVETAFLSNREEAEKLANPAYRQRMAEAIAMGIMKYLPPRYIDIRDHWAKTEIATLSYMGIIKGYQDRLFRPEQNLSRAELISLLDRVIGFEDLLKLDRNESQENPENEVHFSDLSEEYWAYNEIRNAAKLGIIVGYPDGTFKPNKGLSREEMAAILYRALTLEEKDSVDGNSENSLPAGEMNNPADSNDENQTVKNSANQTTEGTEQLEQPDISGNPADVQQEQKEESASVQSMDYEIPFIDVPPDHWSVIAIRSLTSNGIIKGVTDNLFGFGKNVSRAEAAALLYRIITQQEKQPAMVGSNQ